MAEKNKLKENKLDYEPWGYRVNVGYTSMDSAISMAVEKFFANVKYNKNDEKIHFYNIKGEEKGTINVREFPSDSIKSTSYNFVTKVLTITYESGKVIKLDLSSLINSIIDEISVDIDALSGSVVNLSEKVQEVVDKQTALENAAFTYSEYVWDEEHNKMVINFYNSDHTLRDYVEIFDTNNIGEIITGAGEY